MNVNDIQKGTYLKFKEGIWVVTDFQHVFPGKGNAFVRTKLKNLQTGKALEHTFKVVETVESANVEHSNAQYLYNDGTNFVFMDNDSYEQFELSAETLGEDVTNYLVDGQEVVLVKLDGQPINVSLPKKIQLKVVEAPPGVKGDSTSGATKMVTLETGAKLSVPLFINEGDIIVINTEGGNYVERV